MTQKKSTRKSWASRLPDNQVGNKNSWRFRSITTPGHSFSLIQFIAEMVILQRYGKNIPPYFWYKRTERPKMRKDFYDIQNHIVAMIKRDKSVAALRLLSIVCEKFPPLTSHTIANVEQEPSECAEKPLMELESTPDTENIIAIAKRIGD